MTPYNATASQKMTEIRFRDQMRGTRIAAPIKLEPISRIPLYNTDRQTYTHTTIQTHSAHQNQYHKSTQAQASLLKTNRHTRVPRGTYNGHADTQKGSNWRERISAHTHILVHIYTHTYEAVQSKSMSRFVPLHISLQQKDQTTFNSLYSPPFFKRSIPTNHLSRAFIIVSLHFIYVHSLSVLCLSVCVCTYGLMFLTACMSVVKKPSSASAMMLMPQNPARRRERGWIYIYVCVCV